jgi:hypothetical protein
MTHTPPAHEICKFEGYINIDCTAIIRKQIKKFIIKYYIA